LNFPNRSIIALLIIIILLSLVSAADGELEISAFTGDASGSSGYTESLSTNNINYQIHESTALAGSSLSKYFSGTVSKAETFSVTNNVGDHAEVGYKIVNPKSLYYGSYTLSPNTANYAQATEKLNVPAADSIYAFANAKSRDRVTSSSSTSIKEGSLTGYSNEAFAVSGRAYTSQYIGSANGIGAIKIQGSSTNSKKDSTTVSVTMPNGMINVLEMKADSNPTNWPAGIFGADTWLLADLISTTGTCNLHSDASNSKRDKSTTDLWFTNGKITNPSIDSTSYDGSQEEVGTALYWLGPNRQGTITSTGPIKIQGSASDSNGDIATISVNMPSGTIDSRAGYCLSSLIAQDSPYGPEALAFFSPSAINTNGAGTIYDSVSNKEGDKAWTKVELVNGKISYPTIDAEAYPGSVSSDLRLSSASGQITEITSHAENQALAYDPSTKKYHNGGSADFKVKKFYGDQFAYSNVKTTAANSYIDIYSTGFSKTALLLEPFKWETGDIYGKAASAGSSLENKGYAVTDYSNAAVSWDHVHQLDDYDVSAILTHCWAKEGFLGVITRQIVESDGLAIGQYNNGQANVESWATLQPELTNPNDLMLFVGCGSFFTNPSGLSGQDVAKSAKVSGGFDYSVVLQNTPYIWPWNEAYVYPSTDFTNKFFARLAAGDTAEEANKAATKFNPLNPYNWLLKPLKPMVLQGDNTYKLA